MDACGCEDGFEIFDEKSAQADLERYHQHGPDDTTKLLLDMIRERGVGGASVLDIGGGVGVIDHELLGAGAARAVLVDASPPAVEAARSEARRRGTLDRLASYRQPLTPGQALAVAMKIRRDLHSTWG